MKEVISLIAVARHGEHVEREGQVRPLARVPAVGADRGLSVRAGRHVAPAPVARQRPIAQEALELLGPGEPGRERRHRPGGVLGQHRHHPVHVAMPHRVHVALHDVAEAVVAERAQPWPAGSPRGAARRPSCGRAGARCSPRRPSSRATRPSPAPRSRAPRAGSARRAGWRAGAEAPPRTPARRSRAARSAPRARRSRPPGQAPGRGRAPPRSPRSAACRCPGRAGRRTGRSRAGARASAGARSGSGRCWWRSCRARSAASCGPRTCQRAPGAQHRLLEGVLGVVDRADHAVAVGVKLALVGLDQPREGRLVAAAGRLEQLSSWIAALVEGVAIARQIRPRERLHVIAAMSFGHGHGSMAKDDAPSPAIQWSTWSCTPATCARARDFYAELFGWRPEQIHAREGTYEALAMGGARRRRDRRVRHRAPALAALRRGRPDRAGHRARPPARRLGPARAARGAGGLAQRRRRPRPAGRSRSGSRSGE